MIHSQPDYVKLDLAKHGITDLAFDFTLPSDDPHHSAVQSLLEDDTYITARKYRKTKENHVQVQAALRNAEDGAIALTVRYGIGRGIPTTQPPKPLRGPSILPLLFTSDQHYEIECNVIFQHTAENPSDGKALVFPLPFSVNSVGASSAPIDFITGIRGHKLKRDGSEAIEYQFILDRTNEANLYLDLDFTLYESITPALPSLILERGCAIAHGLGLKGATKRR